MPALQPSHTASASIHQSLPWSLCPLHLVIRSAPPNGSPPRAVIPRPDGAKIQLAERSARCKSKRQIVRTTNERLTVAWLAKHPKLTSWVEETMTYFRLPLAHRKTRLPDAPSAASVFLQAFCYVLLIPNVALISSEISSKPHAKLGQCQC